MRDALLDDPAVHATLQVTNQARMTEGWILGVEG